MLAIRFLAPVKYKVMRIYLWLKLNSKIKYITACSLKKYRSIPPCEFHSSNSHETKPTALSTLHHQFLESNKHLVAKYKTDVVYLQDTLSNTHYFCRQTGKAVPSSEGNCINLNLT